MDLSSFSASAVHSQITFEPDLHGISNALDIHGDRCDPLFPVRLAATHACGRTLLARRFYRLQPRDRALPHRTGRVHNFGPLLFASPDIHCIAGGNDGILGDIRAACCCSRRPVGSGYWIVHSIRCYSNRDDLA